mmetsp:Transcript_20805/g.32094  ORF Transcript_20805/g.32094 Transcript_20805/m.32094 type:complete len:103 (+) Transcript_20805:1649-1957(+)
MERKRAARGMDDDFGEEVGAHQEDDVEMKDQAMESKIQMQHLSIHILKSNIMPICENLALYWANNQHELKHALSHKGFLAEKKKSRAVNPSTVQVLNKKHTI